MKLAMEVMRVAERVVSPAATCFEGEEDDEKKEVGAAWKGPRWRRLGESSR